MKWIKEWADNSKLSHRVVSAKIRNKVMTRSEREDWEILKEDESIVQEVVKYFKHLYTSNEVFVLNGVLLMW